MLDLKISGEAKAETIPELYFNSDSFAPTEAVDTMTEFSRGLYSYLPHPDESIRPLKPYLRLRAWSLGDVALAAFENSALKAEAKGLAPEFQDHLVLRIVQDGCVPVESGHHATVMAPGNIYILHPRNTVCPSGPGASIALRIPSKKVGYDPSVHPSILCFGSDDWASQVVISAVQALFPTLPGMQCAAAERTQSMIYSVVGGLLKSIADEEAQDIWCDTRDQTIRRYLLENLKCPEIDTAHLQSKFGVSRATLYRSFAKDGGVVNFVMQARLDAVERDLRCAVPRYGRVRQVAETYQFFDQSSFVKAFKRHHGYRPSEVVGIGAKLDTRTGVETVADSINLPMLASFWSSTK